jgi:hypothetical protein
MTNLSSKVLLCVLGCMLGPALGGYFIGKAIQQYKLNDRVVVVKGLSEREVKSDLAVWKLVYKNSNNDLSLLERKMAADKAAVEGFLLKAGFDAADIKIGNTEVIDKSAREYGSAEDGKTARYIMNGELVLRTHNVDLVSQTQEKIMQLVQKGAVVSGTPAFYYTKLLELRPQMIAEATKNARVSATQFAEDSGSQVGNIRNANQGVFSISAKDSVLHDSYSTDSSSIDKKVRVVSTITFSLVK